MQLAVSCCAGVAQAACLRVRGVHAAAPELCAWVPFGKCSNVGGQHDKALRADVVLAKG